jgi:hypothetical protein
MALLGLDVKNARKNITCFVSTFPACHSYVVSKLCGEQVPFICMFRLAAWCTDGDKTKKLLPQEGDM